MWEGIYVTELGSFHEGCSADADFTSDAALNYMKAGSDHHKMWAILEATFIAFTDEILIPYVRHNIKAGLEVTVDGFWSYLSIINDPNYHYAVEMTLTYLLAFMQLRKGSRCGDAKSIRFAIYKIIPLFFGTNHPIYQELLLNDLLIHKYAPEAVRKCMEETYMVSRTGREGHYQSGDAQLEEINKIGKKRTVGVPSDTQWLKVFRNIENLEAI